MQVKAISGKIEHLFLLACNEPVQLVGMKKQPSVLGWKYASSSNAADAAQLTGKPNEQLLRTAHVSAQSPAAGVTSADLSGILADLPRLTAWLCEAALAPLDTASQGQFSSSTGASHVQATHVVDTGCLHPLQSGLAFTSKPLLWLPFADMESMQCDQRGFGGQARYWDLLVQIKGAKAPVEFKNIAATEKDLVQGFLATRMGAVGAPPPGEPAAGGGGGSSAETAQVSSAAGPAAAAGAASDDDDDSDFHEGGHASDSDGGEAAGGSGSGSGGEEESDSDDDSDSGSEATFPDADDDNSVEFVEEDLDALSGAEEAAAEIAAEGNGGKRKRSRRGHVAQQSSSEDESDATEDEGEGPSASKQPRTLP